MTLSDLMSSLPAPDPAFAGVITNDNNVLAINISNPYDPAAAVSTYAVLQQAIEGVDSNMNPETQEKTYLRAGTSTTKTGTQRTFSVSGDRYIGDDAQDFLFSKKYAVAQEAITDYVYFNLKNGKGERGQIAIMVNSDGSGNAGETAGIDIELNKFGAAPADYTYSAT